jgi:hypothetical protein
VAPRVTTRRRPVRTAGLPPLAVAIVLVLVGCADLDAKPSQGPAATPIRSPALGASAEATRQAVFGALGRQNLIVAPTAAPFRPPESAPLADAPRNVYQVTLPSAPEEGFIVVYELPTEADAVAAAGAQRDYLATGPGRVQAPPGTDHVIQQLGPTVIVYDWLPGGTQDEAAPRVAEALRTIGTTFAVAP